MEKQSLKLDQQPRATMVGTGVARMALSVTLCQCPYESHKPQRRKTQVGGTPLRLKESSVSTLFNTGPHWLQLSVPRGRQLCTDREHGQGTPGGGFWLPGLDHLVVNIPNPPAMALRGSHRGHPKPDLNEKWTLLP